MGKPIKIEKPARDIRIIDFSVEFIPAMYQLNQKYNMDMVEKYIYFERFINDCIERGNKIYLLSDNGIKAYIIDGKELIAMGSYEYIKPLLNTIPSFMITLHKQSDLLRDMLRDGYFLDKHYTAGSLARIIK